MISKTAAAKIDQGIGKCAPQNETVSGCEDFVQGAETHQKTAFEPPGGSVYVLQISENRVEKTNSSFIFNPNPD